MGKKGGSSPPPAPDPFKTAQAQGQMNKEALRESAKINSVNTFTPTGSVTYDRDENGVPTSQYVNVSNTANDTIRRQEGIGNDLTQYAGMRVMGIPTSDFNIGQAPYGSDRAQQLIGGYQQYGDQRSDTPYDPRDYGDLKQYDNRVQDAYMAQQERSLRPQFERQYERQQQDLANRGLPVGGVAYNKATEELNRNQSDAWLNATNQAIMAGGQESDRQRSAEQGLRGTAMAEGLQTHQQGQADTSNQLQAEQTYRGQNINEDVMARSQNVNEIAMLLGQTPALNVPSANAPTNYQLQAPDFMGATYQSYNGQMQAYNAQQAQKGSAWQGAANIASGIGSMAFKSSKTFKHADGPVERTLDRLRDIPIRTWKYRHNIDPRQEVHIGPYAEDWKRILGLGNGKEIAVQDAFGVALKCIQELHDEMDGLRGEIAAIKKGRRK